jgi:hypothetical protein
VVTVISAGRNQKLARRDSAELPYLLCTGETYTSP